MAKAVGLWRYYVMPDVFDPFALFLRFLGAFYVFAGVVAGRAALMSALMDTALAGITLKKVSPRERALSLWLAASAWLVFAGGVLLMVLAREAMWAFILCALTQGFYLTIAAPYYFDTEDPPDPTGRRQTTNAFFIYVAATLLVIWASAAHLTPLDSLHPWLNGAVWLALAAYTGFMIWQSVAVSCLPSVDRSAPEAASTELDDSIDYESLDNENKRFDPRRQRLELRLENDKGQVLDQRTKSPVPLESLPLSDDLKRDLDDWRQNGDPDMSGRAYDLSVRLAQECPEYCVAEPGIPFAYFGWVILSPYAVSSIDPPNWDRMTAVKIMADYNCMPVWAANDGAYGDMPPNVLSVSNELEGALLDWQDAFDASLNLEDPANSYWTNEQFEAHLAQGLELARRVKLERPELTVYAHSMRGQLIVDPQFPADLWRVKAS